MGPNPPLSSDLYAGAIVAFKAASIVVTARAGLAFCGIGFGGTYGTYDVASCVNRKDHVPPHPGCSCGFYAWNSRGPAVRLISDESIVILQVELWGAFHGFAEGYVAAVQRVRKVVLQPYCAGCLSTREQRFRRATVLAGDRRAGADLQPTCDEHAHRGRTAFTLGEVADELGVEVRWAAGDDPVTGAARELAYYRLTHRARPIRRLDDLLPGETAYVFANALAADDDGTLYINPLARLVQPLPGTDIPIRLGDDGVHEVLLDGIRDFDGWAVRHDPTCFALPVRAIGLPTPCTDAA